MLLLKRKSKPVDDRPQNFQKFRDTVESLGLVCELEENVVDGSTDIRPQVQEFSVDAVQSGFEEIAFPRVLGVKQLQQLKMVQKLGCSPKAGFS